jgi:2-(1,2-epoxy-1,2-dihydrophenyl)acetyl-CoA isomerase
VTSVLYRIEGAVAVATLNRPDSLNALDAQLGRDLAEAVRAAGGDAAVRALVLTGAGRAFCAGGDLKSMAAGASVREIERILENFHAVVQLLVDLDKPTIAAIAGPAVGAGMSFALACDLRIASEDASFSQGFVKIGLSPDGGSSWLLPRLVGPAVAARLMMTGETVPARRALELGLVCEVTAAGQHLPRALELASQIARFSPAPLASIKRLLRQSSRNGFANQLADEGAEQTSNAATPEFRAALDVFFKRK